MGLFHCLTSFGSCTVSIRLSNSGSLLSTSTNSSPPEHHVVITAGPSLCLQPRYSQLWLVERFHCQRKLCLGYMYVPKMLTLQMTFPSCIALGKTSALSSWQRRGPAKIQMRKLEVPQHYSCFQMETAWLCAVQAGMRWGCGEVNGGVC